MVAVRAFAVIAAFVSVSISRAGAQLPFRVPNVNWDVDASKQQRRAYGEANKHEVLFCVDSWEKTALDDGTERITVVHAFRERSGARHEIADGGIRCLDPNGKPLPTLHTHADGNCQFSEADLMVIVARGAPFDGIQCGDHYFVWTFAWHILAIANAAERETLRRPDDG
jgi:proteasome lid subunit RPN8/RPN11